MNAPRPMTWGLCLALLGGVVELGFGQSEDALTVRYFQQLRQRRLFSVAEQFGIEQLSSPLNTPEQTIQAAVELSKTYAEHARFTSGIEHEQYWEFAESVLDDALAKHREHPRSLLLDVQRAFVPGEHAEFLRMQLEAFPRDEKLRKHAEEVCQTAIERMKPIETDLAQRRRQLFIHRERSKGQFATYEIQDLQQETRFRLANAMQESAKILPDNSGERPVKLHQALQWLRVLHEAPASDPFKFPAMIHLAENHRLRNDLNGADAVLQELEQESLSAELQQDLIAERVRWLIAQGQWAAALTKLKAAPDATGELAFLECDLLMQQWKAAEQTGNTTQQSQIAEQLKQRQKSAETPKEGYWAYRIKLLGEELAQAQKYGTRVAAIVQLAQEHLAAGKPQVAADTYRQAAKLAFENGKADVGFDLGYMAGSLLVQAKQFETAGPMFQELVRRLPQQERAANAHLLAAYCFGKRYEADPSQPNREAYAEILKAHIASYPKHDTQADALWMLARLEQQQGDRIADLDSALEQYRKIPADHRLGPTAQLAILECHEKILKCLADQQPKTGEPDAALKRTILKREDEASRELQQLLAAYPREPMPLDLMPAKVALGLAQLQLMRTQPDYPRADSVLERILISGTQQLAGNPDKTAETQWQELLKTARQLRIVSLAGQGLSNRAEELVKELSKSNTQDVLGVMDGLMQVAGSVGASTRQQLGALQLQTALELNRRRGELDQSEQQRLDHCLAQAYLATNHPEEALAIYNRMLAAQPKSLGLHIKVAELLVESSDPNCLAKAKELWRQLEAREKPGSLPWLEYRYQVARCCGKLGQTQECRKLLGVTKVLYPNLGNEELRGKYQQLENELNRRK